MPQITAYWKQEPSFNTHQGTTATDHTHSPYLLSDTRGSKHHTIKNSHLQMYPIFTITPEKSYPYLIPDTPITFSTNATKQVTGALLKKQLEQLLQEIYAGHIAFTHFDIIRHKDFNFRAKKRCGFIVLKHKWWPFVVKLSIERPKTFVNPYCKGIVPMFFFFMAGGSNRYMTGLTRIINAHNIQKTVNMHPHWKDCVQIPRKWFWVPEQQFFFNVTGKNIGIDKQTITTSLPSVYAVIADAVDTTHKIPLSTRAKNSMIIKLCNDLSLMIDPHEDNFIFQINPITKKPVIVIIDTEHFPTMVGIKEKQSFTGHFDFYTYLAQKCAQDMFLYTKNKRYKIHAAFPGRELLIL